MTAQTTYTFRRFSQVCAGVGLVLNLFAAVAIVAAAEPKIVIPHQQSAPPGPPLSPEEAIAKMTVPEGFSVELVASEPDIMNPVAMAIDEQGRFWITESFEYPRREPGPGRDRIKVLEDIDGDGRADRVTVFAEGLNIPSGIAVGHGGVWVANAPDILFMQDTDGDGKADRQEVVVTGFGRTDTHELPNSLTWGPDGWLYGLNGVFNHSHVQHRGRDYKFTCALFRIHPRTREFQLFCEGTSNPWGIAYDTNGSAFISACVIDHLWHLTETGYYHRQGGPYPPHTWKLESIVDHKHQMAAYCGLTFFDSDAYPAAYREKLYMGNIHGGCINVDYLTREGSTYFAKPDPDFLTANDVWFMPVVQKTGPDGSLYVLDWYDRYHCYQDANRDPEGIDRGRGRLYRVRYQQTPRAPHFDLTQESDQQLMTRLGSPNIYFRDLAQRLLAERLLDKPNDPQTRRALQQLVHDPSATRKARLHALWALVSGGPLDADFHRTLCGHEDPTFRAWAVRAAGNQRDVEESVRTAILAMTDDASADVRLQVAIAARKLANVDALSLLASVLDNPHPDPIIPQIVWQNLLPLLDTQTDALVARVAAVKNPTDNWNRLLPHAVDRLLASPESAEAVGSIVARTLADARWTSGDDCLEAVRAALMNDARWRAQRDPLAKALLPALQAAMKSQPDNRELQTSAALLGDQAAQEQLRQRIYDTSLSLQDKTEAVECLAALGDPALLKAMEHVLDAHTAGANETEPLAAMITSLGRLAQDEVAPLLLLQYSRLPAAVQPRVIELLTQRSGWARQLLAAIETQRLPRESLHINQIRRLQASNDEGTRDAVVRIWGRIREGRNPAVEESLKVVREMIAEHPGDARRGQAVFQKSCAQCHQIYGQGEQVGPDITGNGRSSFEQLLSNVFDPNLVIGTAYQAHQVITTDGRLLSGLLVEDSPQRVVLKLQGGKLETVARGDIEEMTISPLSLMPEGWEKQLSTQEIVDLLHFLTLDGPPDRADARRLPGTPALRTE